MATNVQQPGIGEITGAVLFYQKPEPLAPELHSNLGVKTIEAPFRFAKAGHAVPLTVGEFPLAALSGPIIFVGEDKMPIAVMGLNAGDNIFVTDKGLFEPGVYIPAYVRRYPFVFATDDAAELMVLCIDRAADFIVEGAAADTPFFEKDGQPSDYTKRCMEFCNNFEVERRRTSAFVDLLKSLDLFETKTAMFTPMNPDGTAAEPQKIAEYFGVSEDKLLKLAPEKLVELRDNGALAQIYAHLLSLAGWDRLVAITLSRAQTTIPQAANA
jgi:hypothetical protein